MIPDSPRWEPRYRGAVDPALLYMPKNNGIARPSLRRGTRVDNVLRNAGLALSAGAEWTTPVRYGGIILNPLLSLDIRRVTWEVDLVNNTRSRSSR